MKKMRKSGVSETSNIDSKLGKFSGTWNDCPEVPNPIQTSPKRHVKSEKEKVCNSKLPFPNGSHKESKPNSSTNKLLSMTNTIDTSNTAAHKADLKRIDACVQQRLQQVKKQSIIKQALSSVDKNKAMNKKIVFFENGEENNNIKSSDQNKATHKRKAMLFDDDGDSEIQSDLELKINHQFKGKKGQKLLELQSKFASDSRFNLDTRFCESSSEDSETEPDITTALSNNERKNIFTALTKLRDTLQIHMESENGSKSSEKELEEMTEISNDERRPLFTSLMQLIDTIQTNVHTVSKNKESNSNTKDSEKETEEIMEMSKRLEFLTSLIKLRDTVETNVHTVSENKELISNSEVSEKEPEEIMERSNRLEFLTTLRKLRDMIQTNFYIVSENKESKSKPEDSIFLRFDPSREDHSKYIKKSKDNSEVIMKDENTKSTKKKRKREIDSADTNVPKENINSLSTEKVFTVKENLKEVLNSGSGSGFSLLQLFGSKENQDSQPDEYETYSVKNKKAKTGKSFKYDSSDSESQDEQEIDIDVDNSKDRQANTSTSKQPICPWGGNFFLADDDLKLQGVFQFIKGAEKENSFGDKRRTLKQFIRNKYKNNQRKKKMFKKKLGKLKRKK